MRNLDNKNYYMSHDSMLELMKIHSPATVAKMKWCKVREDASKICAKDILELSGNPSTHCALCESTGRNCDKCVLKEVTGYNCTQSNSTYNKIWYYTGRNHLEFIQLIDKLISELDKAIELETTKISKPKLKITLTPIDDDKVIMDIENMKDDHELPYEYLRDTPYTYYHVFIKDHQKDPCITIKSSCGTAFRPDGARIIFGWISIGENYPMTREAAMQIIDEIKKCAERLHKINHG